METNSRFNDFENRVYLSKISELAKDLNNMRDPLIFVQRMVSLSILLSHFDRNQDVSFPGIDENANDPTYFLAAYFDTENIAEALRVYRIVKSLTRYVLLLDKFHETGADKYALVAKQVRKSVNGLLQSDYDAQHLTYCMDYLLAQFSEFWKFEQIVKLRIITNHTFSYPEIRHFNLSKSSDASLVYARVLDAKLPSFNENVALVLHYNQALLDILDDWEDIEEDVRDDMPNIFVMAALDNIGYNRIKKSEHGIIRKVVLNGFDSSGGPVSRLVNEIQVSVKDVLISEKFAFLKILSDRYGKTVQTRMSLNS
jgi:hypothetical protein